MARYIIKKGKRIPREQYTDGQGDFPAKAKTAGKGGKADKPGTATRGDKS